MNGTVTLRELQPEDAAALATLANNRNVWLGLRDRFPHPYSAADGASFVSYIHSTDAEIAMAIVLDGVLIGVVGLIWQEDVYSGVGEIGYWLGEQFWGRGLATKALSGFMAQVSNANPTLRRLEAGVFGSNTASIRVLEKCGFEREGVRKSRVLKDGQLLDEHVFGWAQE